MKNIFKQSTFACFSPPVMIATFLIEIGLAFFLVATRRINQTVRITIAFLVALALFQLAEYGICENVGFGGNIWARLGFVSITLVPPLGLHLLYSIAHRRSKWLVPSSYALAVGWIGVFIFSGIMESQVCEGNYVIFHITDPAEIFYYAYYNALVALGLYKGWSFFRQAEKGQTKTAVLFLMVGYLSIIIPSMIVRLIFEFDDATNSSLPSVMCGFAVIMAVIISFKVAPADSKRR